MKDFSMQLVHHMAVLLTSGRLLHALSLLDSTGMQPILGWTDCAYIQWNGVQQARAMRMLLQ